MAYLVVRHRMLTEQQAREIAYTHINEPDPHWKEKPEMVITQIQVHELGWLFYWTSSRYLKTQNISDALAGNGPILVSRETGDFEGAGTAPPHEQRIGEAAERLQRKVEPGGSPNR